MIVVGIDAHKRTHTLVAVDAVGRKLGETTLPATTDGHTKAMWWVRDKFGSNVVWGIEDCRQVTARLERELLAARQRVIRVPPKLMARTRALARTRGKSDPIDALAAARAVLREPDLPIASHDQLSWELKLLVDRREDLVQQRTATVNRLLWRVHDLDPTRAKPVSLNHANHRASLAAWLATQTGLVAELAADELADITRLTEAINVLAKRIAKRVRLAAPSLVAMRGCGDLTAAKILAETAGVARFRSEAAFARHIGVAPLPYWSGDHAVYFRRTRSGNRQLNMAIHRIAVTQIRHPGPGRNYYQQRVDSGDSKAAALRALKRRIARAVFHNLCIDQRQKQLGQTAA